MVTLVGEVGAETFAEHDLGTPQAVADMDIRYLLGGKIGPVYSTCRWMGGSSSSLISYGLHAGHPAIPRH